MRHVLIGPPLRLLTGLHVEGRENVPREGALIVASNHLSFIDSIVIPLASGRQVHFLGKAEYFQGNGRAGRGRAVVPLDRRDHPGRPRRPARGGGLARAVRGRAAPGGGVRRLPRGHPLARRSPAPRPHRCRADGALDRRDPAARVRVIGTDHVQPSGSNGFRPAKVTVRFGVPIDVAGLSAQFQKAALLRAITDATMDAIGELSGQERSGQYASDVKAAMGLVGPTEPSA